MSIRYMPKPLLASILALMSLSLIAMPLASYAAPVDRAASTADAPASAPDRSDDDDDDSSERETSKRSAAQMLSQAENARELRALRQLGVRLQEPCQEAKTAAEEDVNGTLWFLGGCIGGIIGLGAAYIIEPDPPSQALVGKSDQYVAEYTDCYAEAGGDKQQDQALYGCLANAAATAAIYGLQAIVLTSAATTTTTTY